MPAKKEASSRRGRRKTETLVTEPQEKHLEPIAVEASCLENIEETGEAVDKKPPVQKRGRRKAVVVSSEDVSTAIEAVGGTSKNEPEKTMTTAPEEAVAAEEQPKPTLGRRASLRTRPTIISTPKEVSVKKTKPAKTIEESPAKEPLKAKVTRRNSVAVPKSKAVTTIPEPVEKEENVQVQEDTETEQKTVKKLPKSRRQTIAVASADIATPTTKPRKTAKTTKDTASNNIDTYSYNEESDKSLNNDSDKKSLKKKLIQEDLTTVVTNLDQYEKKKLKGKVNKAQLPESENELEKSLGKKKRALKRKSADISSGPLQAVSIQDDLGTTSTPKLFFHSKRVKTTSPTNKLGNNSSKTVYSPFLNTPTKVSRLNTSELEASTYTGTPNTKKIRLLKGI